MTDYRAPLRRALERTPDVTFEARQAVYQRARQILESQLRAATSPVSEEKLERERSNLEAAIVLVEAEFDAPDVSEPVPSQEPSKQRAGAPPPPDEDLPTCGRCSALACPAAAYRDTIARRVKDSRSRLGCRGGHGSPSVRSRSDAARNP